MIEQTGLHRRSLVRHAAPAMVVTEELDLETTGAPGFTDITDDIVAVVAESGITYGTVTVFSRRRTCSTKSA